METPSKVTTGMMYLGFRLARKLWGDKGRCDMKPDGSIVVYENGSEERLLMPSIAAEMELAAHGVIGAREPAQHAAVRVYNEECGRPGNGVSNNE